MVPVCVSYEAFEGLAWRVCNDVFFVAISIFLYDLSIRFAASPVHVNYPITTNGDWTVWLRYSIDARQVYYSEIIVSAD
jgi:hypothetical protein